MSRTSGTGPAKQIEVGTLILTYHRGVSGPTEFQLVTMADFELLRRTIEAYTQVRQLRLMALEGERDVWTILNSAGIQKPAIVSEPTRVTTRIMLYNTDVRGGIVSARKVGIPCYDLRTANLTRTFMVRHIVGSL